MNPQGKISNRPTLLRRLTDILLDNAFKYTSDSGIVRLILESKGERLAISVEDSGVGIAKEERQKIFERFYRVDKARSRAKEAPVLSSRSRNGS